MNGVSSKVSTALAFAGALPFWFFALAPETIAGLNSASAFATYGAIISSFMAGALWGRAQNGKADVALLIPSNVLALASFVTAVFSLSPVALVTQLVVFGLLLLADYRIYAGNLEQRWYWKLRVWVTLVVSFAYAIMLLRYVLGASW
ncbi:DUF3429 domain-containing protein [Rhizobium tumorigenes]|uniref:DUF3429 domain-containing protein n=1 Tax=Rhizobium tumorigenes TaxID=2041385 RepID=A0AAF1KCH6_9HYPH|nr:DUF3429 domain-containing protein [Rhizobium tumorigenes]WFR98914.1 DUF3429 domain-containing protein [Rhizobium tumorigenes]